MLFDALPSLVLPAGLASGVYLVRAGVKTLRLAVR